MSSTLFHFVKQAGSLAQKLTAAGQAAVSDPTSHGFAAWKHCTLHFLRIHMDATYAEIVDCTVLDIDCSAHWPADTRVGRRADLRNAGDPQRPTGRRPLRSSSVDSGRLSGRVSCTTSSGNWR